jgi:excisionase family DNA binding protein
MGRVIDERGWLDYLQAERYTGLSRVTLWRAAGRGELHPARIGRSVRFSRQELERFMREAAGMVEAE